MVLLRPSTYNPMVNMVLFMMKIYIFLDLEIFVWTRKTLQSDLICQKLSKDKKGYLCIKNWPLIYFFKNCIWLDLESSKAGIKWFLNMLFKHM